MVRALVIASSVLVGGTSVADACSKSFPPQDIEPLHYERADDVIVGQAISKTEFWIRKVYKGDLKPTLHRKNTLKFRPSDMCGGGLSDGYHPYYVLFQNGLLATETEHFAGHNDRQFKSLGEALSYGDHLASLVKAAEQRDDIKTRPQSGSAPLTVELDGTDALAERVDARFPATRRCRDPHSGSRNGVFREHKSYGFHIDWGDRTTEQRDQAWLKIKHDGKTCPNPLQYTYKSPGTYTVRVGIIQTEAPYHWVWYDSTEVVVGPSAAAPSLAIIEPQNGTVWEFGTSRGVVWKTAAPQGGDLVGELRAEDGSLLGTLAAPDLNSDGLGTGQLKIPLSVRWGGRSAHRDIEHQTG